MALQSVLVKNTTYLTLSSLAQKALAFWWFTYVASQLQADLLGKYTFAVTYTSIFVILMNFGLIPVLTREGAKHPEDLQRQFKNAISLKIVLTVISVIVLLAVFYILNLSKPMPADTIQLVYLAIGIIVFDTFRAIIFGVLRAQQKMQYEAVGQFFYQVAVVGIGLALFAYGFKAGGLIVAINCASVLYLIYSLYILYRKTAIRLGWNWHGGTMWKLFLTAAPFALADIFFKLNSSIDTVMLAYLAGDRYVAWYSIALKLTVTLTVIPGAFATAFFPAMSQALAKSKEAFRDIFEQSTILLLFMSIPIAIGTAILAPTIIAVAFEDFPAAIPALQWLMTSLVLLFVNYPIGNALNAANKQLLNTLNMGVALVINVVLNVLLIPHYTYLGAAVAATITAVALVLLGLPHVYQLTGFRAIFLLKKAVLLFVAASIMGAVVWWLQTLFAASMLSLALITLAGGAAYFVAVLLVRAVTISDLKTIWRRVLKRS